MNLVKLQEVEMQYSALDTGKSAYAKKQLDNTRAEKLLRLRKGAQVMLIKVQEQFFLVYRLLFIDRKTV